MSSSVDLSQLSDDELLRLRQQAAEQQPAPIVPTPQLQDPSTPQAAAQDPTLFREATMGVPETLAAPVLGAADFAKGLVHSTSLIGQWAERTLGLPGLLYEPGKGLHFASGEELAKIPTAQDKLVGAVHAMLPESGGATTYSGGFARNAVRFALSAATMGKALGPAAAMLPETGTAGAVLGGAVKGALGDAATIDATQGRLSDWLQSIPAVQRTPIAGAITTYLAHQPGDTEAEGKLKTALEGFGLGAVVQGLILPGVQALWHATMLRDAGEAAGEAAPEAAAQAAAPSAADQQVAQSRRLLLQLIGGDETQPTIQPPAEEAAAVPQGTPAQPTSALGTAGPAATARARQVASRFAQPAIAPEPGARTEINWRTINSAGDVKNVLQDLADADEAAITAARRGVVPHAQTILDANQEDAWKIVQSRLPGQVLNSAEGQALKRFWIGSAQKTLELGRAWAQAADGVEKGTVSPEEARLAEVAYLRQEAIHGMAQGQFFGNKAETARALNAFGIHTPGSNLAEYVGRMSAIADSPTGTDSTVGSDALARARMVVELADSGKFSAADQIMSAGTAATGADQVRQLYYDSLLSRPTTLARITIGNTMQLAKRIGDSWIAAHLGEIVDDPSVPKNEAAARFFGVMRGIKAAFTATGDEADVQAREAAKVIQGGGDEAAASLADSSAPSGSQPGGFWRVLRGQQHQEGGYAPEQSGAFSPERLSPQSGVARLIPQKYFTNYGSAEEPVMRLDPQSGLGRFFSGLDRAASFPTRLVAATHEIGRSAAEHMNIGAMAARQAMEEATNGAIEPSEIAERTAEIVNNPSESLKLMASAEADRDMFLNDPNSKWLYPFLQHVRRAPILGPFIQPFAQIPYNIQVEGFENTPFAPFGEHWRGELAAGGARAQMTLTKAATGSAMMATAALLAMEGKISGHGPADPAERDEAMRAGWIPESGRIQTGEDEQGKPIYRHYSLTSFGPVGDVMLLAADAVDVIRNQHWDANVDPDIKWTNALTAAGLATVGLAANPSYMQGFTRAVGALDRNDPAGMEYFLDSLVTSLVPGPAQQIAHVMDPQMHAVHGIWDSLREATPGMGAGMPPKRNLWGEPMSYASGLGMMYDLFSPFRSRSAIPEPIDREMERLQYFVSRPNPKVTYPRENSDGSVTVDLRNHPKILDRYLELVGHGYKDEFTGLGLKDRLNAMVLGKGEEGYLYHHPDPDPDASPDGPHGSRSDMIHNAVREHEEGAQQQLYDESPELRALVATGHTP